MGLSNNGAMVGRLNRIHDFDRAKTKFGEPIVAQANDDAGRTGRGFDLDVGIPRNRFEDCRHFARLDVKQIKVIPGNIDDHGLGFAANGFADAVAQKGEHLEIDPGKFFEYPANIIGYFLLFLSRSRFQFDMKFAAMRGPGIFPQFGPADLLLDGGNVRMGQQVAGNLRAHPDHLRQRRPRRGPYLKHKMTLAKLGQKLAAKERNAASGPDAQQQHGADDGFGPARHEAKHAVIAAFEPVLQPRLALARSAAAEESRSQGWRYGQRHEQRGHDREDVAQRQRGKEAALQSGKQEHRSEEHTSNSSHGYI